MMTASKRRVTELLADLRAGDEAAEADLYEAVYGELRRLARGQRRRWRGDPSLRTTALAHEAYLKLVGPEEQSWEDRSHFFAVAATAMRQILLNEARRQRAEKRGGDAPVLSLEKLRSSLNEEDPSGDGRPDDALLSAEEAELLVLLDEVLDRFEEEHPRAARGVECRFFGGMTIEETAEALGVSTATVSRDWNQARAWLYREMKKMRSEEGGA
jgi:RNA polymerase sigma factor (TIGR02999 family)